MQADDLAGLAADERFRLLKARFRRLALTIVGAFLGLVFPLHRPVGVRPRLHGAARDRQRQRRAAARVLQFVSTFVLAWRYTRYARRMLDPLSAELRDEAGQRQAERERERRILAERHRIENWTRR